MFLKIIQSHSQLILAQVTFRYPSQIALTSFVYANLNRTKWKALCEALEETIPIMFVPWMAVEDFNAILSVKDKKGGNYVGRRCNHFLRIY